MSQNGSTTADELYRPLINLRSKKVIIPAAIVGGAGALFLGSRFLGDIDETATDARIRNPNPVTQDIRNNPIPRPSAELPKAAYPAVTDGELDSFMDRFDIPDAEKEIYREVLIDIDKAMNKRKHTRYEIAEVRDGRVYDGFEKKQIIVYSWHEGKEGEVRLEWLFIPNPGSKYGTGYKQL